MNKILKDVLLRFIKIVDIGYITVLYFIFAIILAQSLDHIFIRLFGDDYENKGKYKVFLEFLCQIILTGIVAYIGRNVIQLIPFPLDGLYGFIHMKVKEVSSGSLLTSITSMFQLTLQEKISYLRKVQNDEYEEKEKKDKKENKEKTDNTLNVDNNHISSR